MKDTDYPVILFKETNEWEKWLKKNCSTAQGIWLKYAKKNTGVSSINHDQAIEVALCYGWIDGQSKGIDDTYWRVKFTPRRAKSVWSQRNCEIVERLIKEGKMKPAGMATVEAAKKDGRWEQAYVSSKNMEMPEDFLNELKKDKKAFEFFKTLNKSNTYAIYWRLQTAKKSETREKRKKQILEMLSAEKKLY